jgi:hypothetical protein
VRAGRRGERERERERVRETLWVLVTWSRRLLLCRARELCWDGDGGRGRAVARVMTTGKKGGTKTTTRPVGSRPIFRPLEITDTIMATMSVVAHSWAHMDRHAQHRRSKPRDAVEVERSAAQPSRRIVWRHRL